MTMDLPNPNFPEAPLFSNWSSVNILECDNYPDLLHASQPDMTTRARASNQRGLVCPIPQDIEINESLLSQWHQSIMAHATYNERTTVEDDIVRGYILSQEEIAAKEGLPAHLIRIAEMLKDAFEANTPATLHKDGKLFVRPNSTHHTRPESHAPFSIANIQGDTTIIYQEGNFGKIIGQRSLPTRSLTVSSNNHGAPPMSDPGSDRLNLIYTPGH